MRRNPPVDQAHFCVEKCNSFKLGQRSTSFVTKIKSHFLLGENCSAKQTCKSSWKETESQHRDTCVLKDDAASGSFLMLLFFGQLTCSIQPSRAQNSIPKFETQIQLKGNRTIENFQCIEHARKAAQLNLIPANRFSFTWMPANRCKQKKAIISLRCFVLSQNNPCLFVALVVLEIQPSLCTLIVVSHVQCETDEHPRDLSEFCQHSWGVTMHLGQGAAKTRQK